MFTKDAKTRDINKELSQVLKERNKKKPKESIELTSSDEEITTTKSLKSPKSPLSSRSSLLSGKSPRDDTAAFFGSTKRPIGKMPNLKSTLSDSEDEKSQGSNYFTRQKKDALYSPKSEKSDASGRIRLNQNTNEKYASPRNEKQNLMSTLKKPLNDTNIKFHKSKLPDTLEESPRSTSHTSPKSSIFSRKEFESEKGSTGLFKSPRSQLGNKTSSQDSLIKGDRKHHGEKDDDDFYISSRSKNNETPFLRKERPKSPKSPRTPNSLSPKGDSEKRRFGKHETYHEKKFEKDEYTERSSRHSSPHEELEEISKREFDKNSSLLHGLLSKSDENINEKSKESKDLVRKEEEKFVNKDELVFDKKVQESQQISEKNLFNDEVNDTADDFNITEKLKRERQEKTKQRLAKTKNQTENTKLFEEAIEKVQFTNEDNQRLKSLKDTISKIDYPTKPSLDEKKVVTERAPRPARSTTRTENSMRTRSLSASARNNRYAHVQPKTVTRLPSSARIGLNDTDLNQSTLEPEGNQNLNDSSTIRQRTYAEWYTKKLSQAQFGLKSTREKLKSEEEKKAIELINKLKKSQLVFQAWEAKKSETKKEEIKKTQILLEKLEEEEHKKKEKEKDSKTAFETWKKRKDRKERHKMKELLEATKALEDAEKDKEKRKREAKKALEAWEKRKDEETKRSLRELQDKLKSTEDLSKTSKDKQKLSEQAFREWLEKKEQQILNESNNFNMSRNHSRSSNTVNAGLPPFYPSSRTIPFGR